MSSGWRWGEVGWGEKKEENCGEGKGRVLCEGEGAMWSDFWGGVGGLSGRRWRGRGTG